MTKEQAQNNVIKLELKNNYITKFKGTGMNKNTMCIRIGEDGNVLMDYTIKDINNETVAKIINSKPVCIDEAFECTCNNDGLIIKDKKTKDICLDFSYPSPSKLSLSGIQWVVGEKFVRTDHELNVNGTQLKT